MSKYIGRCAITSVTREGSEFISHTLYVRVKDKACEYSPIKLKLTAQSDARNPERAYALHIADLPYFDDWQFLDCLVFLRSVKRTMDNVEAPRAILTDEGKAILVTCELAQFETTMRKLGVKVRHFKTTGEAYDWADEREDAASVSVAEKAVIADLTKAVSA